MNNIFEIFINHNDWNGICILNNENNTISRKNNNNDNGTYKIKNNELIIKWEQWNEERFFSAYKKNNIFYNEKLYNECYQNIYIMDNVNKFLLILDKNNNKFIIWENNIYGSYKFTENILELIIKNNIIKKYNKINDYLFYSNNIEDNFFELELINNDKIKKKFLFNKLNKTFINIYSVEECGFYRIEDNLINLQWNSEKEEKFYFNNFYQYQNLHNENIECKYNSDKINIIKPNKIMINDKLLFSNISLCHNKIILTSIYYRYEHFDVNSIILNIKNINQNKQYYNKITNKIIYENNDYESSFTIILELEKVESELLLEIEYKNNNYFKKEIVLTQLKIPKHNLASMTLFKDDYELLEKYLSYYYDKGIEIFFMYYNEKMNNDLIQYLEKINNKNNYKYTIYITEWDYVYMWKVSESEKHHYAQTMAMNDALNILKNYGNYILYNDLDEYFIMPENSNNFICMLEKNPDIDVFIFKNQFCKMGIDDELIKYSEFNEKFDLKKIILGNYWESGREKNIIKSCNINVMGIHKFFEEFNNINVDSENKIPKQIKSLIINKFYHIINFEEKNREIYMTEYIE